MKKETKRFIVAGALTVALVVSVVRVVVWQKSLGRLGLRGSREVVEKTWLGFKFYFITTDGRVVRVQQEDTASQGQALAMLRAAWMGDKETFDKCYAWTEKNLSRLRQEGDNLLAWNWKDGEVTDWTPSSDADIDYALSLVFADTLWQGQAPSGLTDYGEKARALLKDILRLETYVTHRGRRFLSPWLAEGIAEQQLQPVNPSYYSPAHFRVFYEYTHDERWKELVDASYFVLYSVAQELSGVAGKGLVPDWCTVDTNEVFRPFAGHNSGFGWEGIKAPLKVALDYYWFNSSEAKGFFSLGLGEFVQGEWQKHRAVYCEYDYTGTLYATYENALFYASYAFPLIIKGIPLGGEILQAQRKTIKKCGNRWVYEGRNAYYLNALGWYAEGLNAGVIRNILAEKDNKK